MNIEQPSRYSWGTSIVLIIALIATVAGAVSTALMMRTVRQKQAEVAEATRPAAVHVVKITAQQCAACFSLDSALDALKRERVTIVDEKTVSADSDEGKKLIADHGILKIPTYILTGEVSTDKFGAFMEANGAQHGDTFIFTNAPPAFVDLSDKKEHGSVDVTIIASPTECKECADPLPFIDVLRQRHGVAFREERVLQRASKDAGALIAKYQIRKLPAVVISGDVAFYPLFQDPSLGRRAKDGAFIAKDMFFPYFDVARGSVVRGAVELIMLTDETCTECYDARNHKEPLAQLRVQIASEKTVDIGTSEGKKLLATYGITKVPTVLLSPDARAYEGLTEIWNRVGSIARDGRYVFRNFEVLGPTVVYHDLARKKIMNTKTTK